METTSKVKLGLYTLQELNLRVLATSYPMGAGEEVLGSQV